MPMQPPDDQRTACHPEDASDGEWQQRFDHRSDGPLGVPSENEHGAKKGVYETLIDQRDEIVRLRAALAAVSEERDRALQDTRRVDWLEAHGGLSIYFIRDGQQSNPASQSLRSAIDGELAASLSVVEEPST